MSVYARAIADWTKETLAKVESMDFAVPGYVPGTRDEAKKVFGTQYASFGASEQISYLNKMPTFNRSDSAVDDTAAGRMRKSFVRAGPGAGGSLKKSMTMTRRMSVLFGASGLRIPMDHIYMYGSVAAGVLAAHRLTRCKCDCMDPWDEAFVTNAADKREGSVGGKNALSKRAARRESIRDLMHKGEPDRKSGAENTKRLKGSLGVNGSTRFEGSTRLEGSGSILDGSSSFATQQSRASTLGSVDAVSLELPPCVEQILKKRLPVLSATKVRSFLSCNPRAQLDECVSGLEFFSALIKEQVTMEKQQVIEKCAARKKALALYSKTVSQGGGSGIFGTSGSPRSSAVLGRKSTRGSMACVLRLRAARMSEARKSGVGFPQRSSFFAGPSSNPGSAILSRSPSQVDCAADIANQLVELQQLNEADYRKWYDHQVKMAFNKYGAVPVRSSEEGATELESGSQIDQETEPTDSFFSSADLTGSSFGVSNVDGIFHYSKLDINHDLPRIEAVGADLGKSSEASLDQTEPPANQNEGGSKAGNPTMQSKNSSDAKALSPSALKDQALPEATEAGAEESQNEGKKSKWLDFVKPLPPADMTLWKNPSPLKELEKKWDLARKAKHEKLLSPIVGDIVTDAEAIAKNSLMQLVD